MATAQHSKQPHRTRSPHLTEADPVPVPTYGVFRKGGGGTGSTAHDGWVRQEAHSVLSIVCSTMARPRACPQSIHLLASHLSPGAGCQLQHGHPRGNAVQHLVTLARSLLCPPPTRLPATATLPVHSTRDTCPRATCLRATHVPMRHRPIRHVPRWASASPQPHCPADLPFSYLHLPHP